MRRWHLVGAQSIRRRLRRARFLNTGTSMFLPGQSLPFISILDRAPWPQSTLMTGLAVVWCRYPQKSLVLVSAWLVVADLESHQRLSSSRHVCPPAGDQASGSVALDSPVKSLRQSSDRSEPTRDFANGANRAVSLTATASAGPLASTDDTWLELPRVRFHSASVAPSVCAHTAVLLRLLASISVAQLPGRPR
jgi:hypothetical protein